MVCVVDSRECPFVVDADPIFLKLEGLEILRSSLIQGWIESESSRRDETSPKKPFAAGLTYISDASRSSLSRKLGIVTPGW